MSLDRQLSALEAADLIRQAQQQPELEYLFRHALVQDAVYGSLLRNNRRVLHQAVGELLEKLYVGRLAEHAAVLAHHFQQAGDVRRALRYLELAGDAAAGKFALAESALHYGHALELAGQTPEEPSQYCRLTINRGRILELSGRNDEALAGYHDLQLVGERTADRDLELAALMAQAVLRATPTPKYDPVQGAQLVERTLALAHDVGDRTAEAKILWIRMVLVIYSGGDWAIAQADGERALELARVLLASPQAPAESRALRDLLGFILHDIFFVYLYWGMIERAEAVLLEAVELLRELGNLPLLAETLVFLANTCLMTGRYDEALRFADESRQVGDAGQHEYSQSYGRILTGRIFLDRGEFGGALAMMEDAIVMGERAGNLGLSFFTRSDLAWGYGLLGAFEQSLQAARRAQQIAEAIVPHWMVMAQAVQVRVHLLAGDTAAAQQAMSGMQGSYDDIMMLRSRLGAFMPSWAEVVLAEITYALSDHAYARALTLAEDYLKEIGRGAYRHFMPEALYLKGRALLAQGDVSGALHVLSEARAAAEFLGARRQLWPILAALGETADWQGNAEEALSLRREAKGHISFIAEHTPGEEYRQSFLALPAVASIWSCV